MPNALSLRPRCNWKSPCEPEFGGLGISDQNSRIETAARLALLTPFWFGSSRVVHLPVELQQIFARGLREFLLGRFPRLRVPIAPRDH
jgi:hypothetical protein